MYSEKYEKIKVRISSFKYGITGLRLVNKLTAAIVYISYPIGLLVLFYRRDPRLWSLILVPASSFILLSIFRNILNLPRPYEKYDIAPIIEKDTSGKSFPSRHVFSVFVIAASFYQIWPLAGLILMFIGLIIGLVRVLGGVHFTVDVLVGGIVGLLLAFIGWNINIF